MIWKLNAIYIDNYEQAFFLSANPKKIFFSVIFLFFDIILRLLIQRFTLFKFKW